MGAKINTSLSKQYLIAGCLYMGQLMVGYTLGWTGPVLTKLQNDDETPLENALSDGEVSWVVSFIFIGTILGPYISAYLCNVIGRKPCLYLGGAVLVLAYAVMALAKNLPTLFAGRVLTGVGHGVVFVTNLVYIGEFSSTNIRGTLLSLTGFSSTFGTVIVYIVGPYVSYAAVCWLGAAISCVYVVGVFLFVTETAVYLVMKGNKEEAMAILTAHGREDDINEVVAKANEKPKSNMAQLTEMYTVRSNRRAAFIIIVLNILQQTSGVVAVIAFVTIIFDMTGSNMESHISTIIVGVTQMVAATIAPVLVDRTGRTSLLMVSTAACSISLAALGAYFYMYTNDLPAADDFQWLALVSLILYSISYFGGFGIIPNTFIGKMFTDTCRGFGGTFTVTIGWLFGFGVATAFGYMLPAWGPSVTFWIFSAACAFSCFFSAIFVPETKGKSLLEIQEILSRSWL